MSADGITTIATFLQENNTDPGNSEQVTAKTVLAACFVGSVVLFGVVGNAVIIASVVRDHRLHTRGNFLIALVCYIYNYSNKTYF